MLLISPYVLQPPGLQFLQQRSKLFHDFTQLSGVDGAAITSVPDSGPNNYDSSNTTPAQSPTITKWINGVHENNGFKAFPSSGSKDVIINSQPGNTFFRSSFEVWSVFSVTGSNTIYDFDLCGVGDTSTDYFRLTFNTNQWNIQYRYSAAGGKFFYALSPTSFFSSFPRGKTLLRYKMDFENNVCKLSINGEDITLSFNGTNTIDTVDPLNFACPTSKFCIGGRNDIGVITAKSNYHTQYAFAITPICSNQEALDVSDHLINEIGNG
jgi:hypothetical protein